MPARGFERHHEAGLIEDVLHRVGFTVAMCAMVVLAGWLTGTASGQALGLRATHRLGFAPVDTTSLDLARAVMSAFVTDSPVAYWAALAYIAVACGAIEWMTGTVSAVVAFWGSHLLTLAMSFVLLAPLDLAGSALGRLVYLARDVGPSAGYVGCFGYLCAMAPPRWRTIVFAAGVLLFTGLLALTLPRLNEDPAVVSAALSHVLAFVSGFVLRSLGQITRKRFAPAQDAVDVPDDGVLP